MSRQSVALEHAIGLEQLSRDEMPTAAHTPESILLWAEEDRREGNLEDIALAVTMNLPTVLAEVAEYRFFHGLTRAQTGALLNLTVAQVEVRERRARGLLLAAVAAEVV